MEREQPKFNSNLKDMKSEFYISESLLVLNETQRTVSVEVVFGMPAKDCLYHGICRIEPASSAPQGISTQGINTMGASGTAKSSAYVKAEVSATSTGQLVFRFRKDGILRGKASRHFGSGYFIVLEPIDLPDWVSDGLELPAFKIWCGIYHVNEKALYYEVTFPRIR